MLTTAQLQTLKTYIASVPALAAQPMTPDGHQAVADALNLEAAPAFVVWRSEVSANEIGNAWSGTDIAGMSSLNMQRLQLLLASSPGGTFDMRRADRRQGFEDPFGTNQNNASRVAMRAVWKRNATQAEKLLASGTGSDAAPAITTFEGSVSRDDVERARLI